MKIRQQIKKERLEDPKKRDNYLCDMRQTSEKIIQGMRKNPLDHTCHEKDFCMACSLGQQSAELADEGIGIEGIDY